MRATEVICFECDAPPGKGCQSRAYTRRDHAWPMSRPIVRSIDPHRVRKELFVRVKRATETELVALRVIGWIDERITTKVIAEESPVNFLTGEVS